MADEKIQEAVKKADSSVALESGPNNNVGLAMIYEALRRAKNNGSFFEELVKLDKEKQVEIREREATRYGKK